MPGKARALGLQTQRPAACLPHRYLLVQGSSEGFGDEGSGAVQCARERISILNAQGDYASELAR